MRSISASGTRRSPTFLLSLSTNTGRAGSRRAQRVPERGVEGLLRGCGSPGTRPSTEPRWLASASRSSTCAPARAAPAAGGSCPSRSAPQTTRSRSAPAASPSVGDDGAAERLVAALEQVDAKADLVEHRGRASRCAGRRASSRPAAASRAACRAHGARCARRRCAPTSAAPRFLAVERRDLLVFGADEARSASSSDGQLTAPGRSVDRRTRSSASARRRWRCRRHRADRWSLRMPAASGRPRLAAPSGRSDSRRHLADRVEQLGLDLQLQLVLLQRGAVDQEGVLDPLAQRGDLGQLQVDVVPGQHPRDRVEQARAVAGRDAEQPALGLFVGPR